MNRSDISKKAWITRYERYGPTGFKDPNCMKGDNNPAKRLEVRKKISDAKKGKPNPKLSIAMKGRKMPWIKGDKHPMKRPEVRAKVSKALKGRSLPWFEGDKHPLKNPETADKVSKSHKRMWANMSNEERESRSNLIKAVWAKMTKEERESRLKHLRLKPNNKEKHVDKIVSPLGFKMNVIKCKMIGKHRPDFIHKHEQRIIEFDGGAGHHPILPWTPDSWEGCLDKDDKRDQSYRDAGYYILRIFPEDLVEGDNFTRDKVEKWML